MKKKLKLSLIALSALLLAAVFLSAFSYAPASAATLHTGVDFAWHGNLNPQAYKAKNVQFVVRYLAGHRWPDKEISKAEADMWSNSGINVVLVWETWASRATEGYQAGQQDAWEAFSQAAAVGMPHGKPVYFAVDEDVSGPAVAEYFHGIYDWARTHFGDGLASPRIGIYDGYEPVKYIRDRGFADYGWQTLAWIRDHGWLEDAMQQHAIEANIDGTQTDLNRVAFDDYGGWISVSVAQAQKAQAEKVAQAKADRADAQTAAAQPRVAATVAMAPAASAVDASLAVAKPADVSTPARVLPVAPPSLKIALTVKAAAAAANYKLAGSFLSWPAFATK